MIAIIEPTERRQKSLIMLKTRGLILVSDNKYYVNQESG